MSDASVGMSGLLAVKAASVKLHATRHGTKPNPPARLPMAVAGPMMGLLTRISTGISHWQEQG